jgi:branched-chain amino acid transport system substrate-binding protein
MLFIKTDRVELFTKKHDIFCRRWDMKRKILLLLLFSIVFLPLIRYEAAASAQKSAIKIGILDDFSGGLAAQGREMAAAVKVFFREKNWEVAGRKIELFTEDTKLKADTALTKTKKLVLNDEVHFLIGAHGSGDALAIRDFVNQQKIPLLTVAGAEALTRDLKSPYIFRTRAATPQYAYPLGVYAAKQGYKRAILMGIDYVAAHQAGLVLKAGFEDNGGKVVDQAWSKWGTTDFSPYFAKILGKKGEIDVALTCYWGPEAGRFFAQYDEYGLKGVVPIYNAGGLDETALPSMGKHGIGIRHLFVYTSTIDTPKNRQFVDAMVEEMGRRPGTFACAGYYTARIAWNALQKISGEIENTPRFLDALRKTDFKSDLTGGRLRFDARQGIIQDLYLMEIRELKGEIVNIVIKTFPQVEDNVEQFPTEFIKR